MSQRYKNKLFLCDTTVFLKPLGILQIIIYNILKNKETKKPSNQEYIFLKGSVAMEKKIVSISSKRQITIPQKFFALLGFGTEAECLVRGNELVIRPARQSVGGEFAEYILADLIAQGLSNKELLDEFKSKQTKVRPAVETMIADADEAAMGNREYTTYDDIFNTEDDE